MNNLDKTTVDQDTVQGGCNFKSSQFIFSPLLKGQFLKIFEQMQAERNRFYKKNTILFGSLK
jgi:hypothetical protein